MGSMWLLFMGIIFVSYILYALWGRRIGLLQGKRIYYDRSEEVFLYFVVPLIVAVAVWFLSIYFVTDPVFNKYKKQGYEQGYQQALIDVYCESPDSVKWDVEMEIKVDTIYNFKRKMK